MIKWFALMLIVSLFSCYNRPEPENDLERIIGQPFIFPIIEEVIKPDGSRISYLEFRHQYNYISVVFLKETCQPCYNKFIEWNQKMTEFESLPARYTVLFVISAPRYDTFLDRVVPYGSPENRFYTIMDPSDDFFSKNQNIPRWAIDRSLMIDRNNNIRMIGEPFKSNDMKQLFKHIIKTDN